MDTTEIIVRGRVQGVGFRLYTYKLANKLEINGFVQNSMLKYNVVEIHAQGDKSTLLNFIKSLKLGPALSRVDSISERKLNLPEYASFTIK